MSLCHWFITDDSGPASGLSLVLRSDYNEDGEEFEEVCHPDDRAADTTDRPEGRESLIQQEEDTEAETHFV